MRERLDSGTDAPAPDGPLRVLGVADVLAVVAAQAREVLGAEWVGVSSEPGPGRPPRSSCSPGGPQPVAAPDLVLPLEDGPERRIGVLEVATGPDGVTAEVQALAAVCARMASIALAHADRYEAAQRDVDRLSDVIAEAPTAIVEVDLAGVVRLWNPAAEVVFGWAAADVLGGPLAALRLDPDGTLSDLVDRAGAGGSSRGAVVAVRRRDGGSAWLEVSTAPLSDPSGMVSRVLVLCTDVTARHDADTRLAHRALHDELTDLANRTLFRDHLEGAVARCRRSGERLAVVFVDLDGFKQVNDERGHDVGDRVLVAVAGRLASAVRDGDTVARIGGDEFAVCCEEVADEREALALAERLAAVVAEPIVTDEEHCTVRASIGVALSVTAGLDPDQLVRDADAAMYRAKARGRGGCEVAGHPDAGARGRWSPSTGELRGALHRGELRLHYQTAARLLDGVIVGAEALLRWDRPTTGLLPPAHFVGAAERTGLIVPIGAWTLWRACEQIVSWRTESGEADLQVWVNVSPRQLVEPGLVRLVGEVLDATGCPAAALVLEVPERALAPHSPLVRRHLRALRTMGVRVAVDDFGTGGSPLAGLKGLPVDAVKLDPSVVAGVDRDRADRGVAAAALQLARALGLVTVAEGVERVGQLEVLAELGCDVAQGYRIAVPTRAGRVRLERFDPAARRPAPPHA